MSTGESVGGLKVKRYLSDIGFGGAAADTYPSGNRFRCQSSQYHVAGIYKNNGFGFAAVGHVY